MPSASLLSSAWPHRGRPSEPQPEKLRPLRVEARWRTLHMGNLCSSGAAPEAKDASHASQDNALHHSPPPAPSSSGAVQASSNQAASKPLTPIDLSIASARRELEKNKDVVFESRYTTSKLIGHGAFAKVSICEHNTTKIQYAAKVVTKNADDPDKQREGELTPSAPGRGLALPGHHLRSCMLSLSLSP